MSEWRLTATDRALLRECFADARKRVLDRKALNKSFLEYANKRHEELVRWKRKKLEDECKELREAVAAARVAQTSAQPSPPDETCVVCMDAPKEVTLVHGDTGHFCCCASCAKRLQDRDKPCPVCRADIDRAIRQF